MAHPKGRIIGTWCSPLAGLEDIPEIGGSGPQSAVDRDIALKIEVGKGSPEVLSRRLQSDCISGNIDAIELPGSAAIDKHINRPDDFPPSVFWYRFAGNDLTLVGIMVEHRATFFKICKGQSPTDGLRNPVGKTIGMAQAFPLDKLNPLSFERNLMQRLNSDISLHLMVILQQYNHNKNDGKSFNHSFLMNGIHTIVFNEKT
jgi:hypothetical protein